MTDSEQILLEELRALRADITSLRAVVDFLCSEFTISQITYFENLAAAAVVGADYVAYRFHCSTDAVVRGRFETDKIPRLRQKPIAFIKRDVDAVWLGLNKPISDVAAEYRHKINTRRTKK